MTAMRIVHLLALLATAAAQSPKRGLVYFETAWPQDAAFWTQPGSDLTWYYNYEDAPSSRISSGDTDPEFVPMMWGLRNDDPTDTSFLSNVQALISNGTVGNITHVLAFNEPDGDHSTGGSSMDTTSAAKAWVANFEPLREMGLKVGLPAMTGAPSGLVWLQGFLDECRTVLSEQVGSERNCTFDVVPVHWYDNFEGLASHIGERASLFPGKEIWVTEFAYANQDLETTQAYFNTTMDYLDRVPEVARYSYFGAFRSSVSNVGPSSAFLSSDGQLTDIGSWYLGFGATGVVPTAAAPRISAWGCALLGIGVSVAMSFL